MIHIFKNKYLLANVVLVTFAFGFLLTYPHRGNIFAGMAFSFFSAALVGGLADWFAVTALFRRPLGIPSWKFIRTEIVPRNRERFIKDLTTMVTEELLTKENLKHRLHAFDISQLLIDYLEISRGKEELNKIIGAIVQDLLGKVDPYSVGRLVEDLLKQNAPRVKLSPLFVEAVDYSIKNGYDHRIMDFALDELSGIIQQPQIHGVLAELIERAFLAYEKGMARRQFVDYFIKDADTQARMLQDYVINLLAEIKADNSHPVRRELSGRLNALMENLKTSPELAQKLEDWKLEQLEKLSIQTQVAEYVQAKLEAAASGKGDLEKLLNRIEGFTGGLLEDFKSSEEQRNSFDAMIKNYLSQLIDKEHGQVGRMVSESLQKYSNVEVVKLLEERVGNDLQVIRLTGAMVGGFTGLFIFAVLHIKLLAGVLR